MPNRDIEKILSSEIAIFNLFGVKKNISSNCIAFATPGIGCVAHWNLLYSYSVNYEYMAEEVNRAFLFYNELNLDGNFLTFNPVWKALSVEQPEYFMAEPFYQPHCHPELIRMNSFLIEDQASYDNFCDIMKVCFELDDLVSDFFKRRIQLIATQIKVKFWLINYDKKRCGIGSTFCVGGESEFLFNVGILPEFRGMGLSLQLIQGIMKATRRPVYTYSDNPIMCSNVLPRLNFRKIGVGYLVPIKKHVKLSNDYF